MITKQRATIEDLYRVPDDGKAELVNGEIVRMSPTGAKPGRIGGEIYFNLRLYEEQTDRGYAFPDNVGFVVRLPNRDSFSPDAAWYVGDEEDIADMKFLDGAPAFAAEVRSENDYSPKAERDIADKIRDYFTAGTQVVWDVDSREPEVVRKYTADDADNPITFRRGDVADAEPAVPGWRMPVDNLFRSRRRR